MINKDTKIYCSFAKEAGNVGCQVFNSGMMIFLNFDMTSSVLSGNGLM